MKKTTVSISITFIFLWFAANAYASQNADLTPVLKNGNEKYRIALIRSGGYWQYAANFRNILKGLKDYGWLTDFAFPKKGAENIPAMLQAMAGIGYSDYIIFDPNLYFDFKFNETNMEDPRFNEIIGDKTGADLIISFGTRASKIISRAESLAVPVVAVQISDPLRAGVIRSCENSGNELLTARCDLEKYVRQIRVFHNVVGFSKLGMIYEDTETGRAIAALDHVNALAKEEKFSIVKDTQAVANGPEAAEQYLEAVKRIVPKIDALYMTIHGGLTIERMPKIMEEINRYRIPTFAMEGPQFVKHGALLSISSQEQRATGEYNAAKIVRILKGEKPGRLDQKFSITPMIAINLKEAKLIGYDPPVDILAATDEVYVEITMPEEK